MLHTILSLLQMSYLKTTRLKMCFGQLAKCVQTRSMGAKLGSARYSNISHCSVLREPGDACHARTRNLEKYTINDEKI